MAHASMKERENRAKPETGSKSVQPLSGVSAEKHQPDVPHIFTLLMVIVKYGFVQFY